MKHREVVTLDQVLSSKKALSSKKLKKGELSEGVTKLKESFTKEVKIFWPAVCVIILKKLLETLNVKIASVLVDAWKKYQEIRQYTDAKKYPP